MLPCDSEVPKEPFSFRGDDNAGTKAFSSHAGGALHASAKEELGWGGDLRRGYATSCPPRQVNDSNKGSNGAAS